MLSNMFCSPVRLRSLGRSFLNQALPSLKPVAGSRKIASIGLCSLRFKPLKPIKPNSAQSSLRRDLGLVSLRRIHVPPFRCFSSRNPTCSAVELSTLPPPAVGRWLLFSSALVFAVIVVGGVTRLTESGLSITEWRPVTGILPPLSEAAWDQEFAKYQATPEFKLLNQNISLDAFKNIFYMEWSHRMLGRVVGIAFIAPLIYFVSRRQITRAMSVRLFGMSLLIGFQGVLGWYMVKSGLEDSLLDTPGAVPRVSQYRLAAHLGTALALYAAMLGTGLAIIKDRKFFNTGLWAGAAWPNVRLDGVIKLTRYSWALTGLVFLTALSGAFVAGLDAGLLYNEFPLMGGRIAPPIDEMFATIYTKNADGSDLWRNIFENPTTVQFTHRVLAMTTYVSTALLWSQIWRPSIRSTIPPVVRACVHTAFAMVNVQAILGISTLLYLVPTALAAAHQAGSIAVLSAMIHLLVALQGPGRVALARRMALVRAPSHSHSPSPPIGKALLSTRAEPKLSGRRS